MLLLDVVGALDDHIVVDVVIAVVVLGSCGGARIVFLGLNR